MGTTYRLARQKSKKILPVECSNKLRQICDIYLLGNSKTDSSTKTHAASHLKEDFSVGSQHPQSRTSATKAKTWKKMNAILAMGRDDTPCRGYCQVEKCSGKKAQPEPQHSTGMTPRRISYFTMGEDFLTLDLDPTLCQDSISIVMWIETTTHEEETTHSSDARDGISHRHEWRVKSRGHTPNSVVSNNPSQAKCGSHSARVSNARTMAPMFLAWPTAARPATPPPMTKTLAGGTFPAAAKRIPQGPDPTAHLPLLAESPVESLGGLASATNGQYLDQGIQSRIFGIAEDLSRISPPYLSKLLPLM
ncbi:unnamed protein product [Darwinula stevensoni]|uniref:Uncharacterized protein n=1 Tax=Darwinula stevensoni TaxID=69355 RepID=A0A7R9A3T0_9CRUS|nr:unnamed protein product [Darwinula stevensoni]CAG0891216.1 unnamed protein product [Darwinula stevensoni]